MKEVEVRPNDAVVDVKPNEGEDLVPACMGCWPLSERQGVDKIKTTDGYCPPCGILFLLEEKQNGSKDGDGEKINGSRRATRMRIAIKMGSRIEDSEYDPKSDGRYVAGVSEQRLEEARKALQEARSMLNQLEEREAMVFIQGHIQEYWNKVA